MVVPDGLTVITPEPRQGNVVWNPAQALNQVFAWVWWKVTKGIFDGKNVCSSKIKWVIIEGKVLSCICCFIFFVSTILSCSNITVLLDWIVKCTSQCSSSTIYIRNKSNISFCIHAWWACWWPRQANMSFSSLKIYRFHVWEKAICRATVQNWTVDFKSLQGSQKSFLWLPPPIEYAINSYFRDHKHHRINMIHVLYCTCMKHLTIVNICNLGFRRWLWWVESLFSALPRKTKAYSRE